MACLALYITLPALIALHTGYMDRRMAYFYDAVQ